MTFACLVAALAVLLFRKHRNRPQVAKVTRIEKIQPMTEKEETKPPSLSPSPAAARTVSEQATSNNPLKVELLRTTVPAAEGRKKTIEPFQLRGRGSRATIVDAHGNIVFMADSTIGIYACEVSPDAKHLAVYFGSSESIVLEPETGTKIALPKQPPGENKFGFGHWRWIDNNTLLGESGDERLDRKPGADGEGNNVARSRLYLYEITEHKLEEMNMPKDLGAKVFSVTEVNADGSIHLVHDDTSAERPPDLGWFKVSGK